MDVKLSLQITEIKDNTKKVKLFHNIPVTHSRAILPALTRLINYSYMTNYSNYDIYKITTKQPQK